jgi:uncharacterized protein
VLADILQAFWLVTTQMAPWLLLGFLAAGLLSTYVSPRWLERHLGGRGMSPVWKAALFGVPLPLCSCGVIPVGASLRRHGASPAATVSFMLATPQTGVDSIAVTATLLGPVFAVIRPLIALVTGIVGGGLVHAAAGTPAAAPTGPPAGDGRAGAGRLWAALRYGFETLPRDIGRPLLIGLSLAAVITALVPAGALASQMGGGVLPILVMMLAGIPIYACATGSVPLVAGFIHAGVSPGAGLAYLIAGPATSLAAISALLKILGRRVTLIYLATVASSALGGGLLLDALFEGLDLAVPLFGGGDHDHAHLTWLDHLWAGLLVANLAWVFRPRRAAPAAATPTASGDRRVELAVAGMSCSQCQDSVRRALGEHEGVRRVEVDLAQGRAVVEGPRLDPDALAAAVAAVGYQARLLSAA